jgi:hypothetical protein
VVVTRGNGRHHFDATTVRTGAGEGLTRAFISTIQESGESLTAAKKKNTSANDPDRVSFSPKPRDERLMMNEWSKTNFDRVCFPFLVMIAAQVELSLVYFPR